MLLGILLSLVGSVHRGEAGHTANRADFDTNLRSSYFRSRLISINAMLIAGHAAQALPLFESGYQEVKAFGDSKNQRLFLSNIGACQLPLNSIPKL